MKKIISGALSLVVLGLLTRATAEPISVFTEGPGHSWDVTWDDTSDGNPINEIVAVIVSGPSVFDGSLSTTIPSWTTPGTLVNPDETFIKGPVDTADKDITLSFADPEPVTGNVVVNIYELYNGHLAAYGSFQWEDLPDQGNWINLPVGAPIPSNIPDGGFTASMLGMGLLGLCYIRRMVK